MKFNNGQVNLWRGTGTPTTPYHIWIDTSDNTIKIFNGDDDRCKKEWEDRTKWVAISAAGVSGDTDKDEGSEDTGKLVGEVAEAIEAINKVTINGINLLDSPELFGTDIKIGAGDDVTVASAIESLNASMETLIYN
jgi:hypothetical protein